MTLASVGQVHWPHPLIQPTGNSSHAGSFVTFDSVNDRLAWVGNSPITDSLTTVYFKMGATVTTGSTVDVRIETVSNGVPTGTLFGANTNVTVVVADTDDGVWKTATLTAAASINAGDEFAIVIVNSSGTPNMRFATFNIVFTGLVSRSPVCLQDTGGGTWAQAGVPFCWFTKWTTNSVIFLPYLCSIEQDATLTAFNSGSAADEFALKIIPTFKCRVIGVSAPIFNVQAGADYTVSLWPASSTTDGDALGQQAHDGELGSSTTTDGHAECYFPSPITLTAGTTYYMGLRADTANNISIVELTTPSSITDSMKAVSPLQSTTMVKATRAWTAGSAGSWTEAANSYIPFSIIIDQLDDGFGSGEATYLMGLGV